MSLNIIQSYLQSLYLPGGMGGEAEDVKVKPEAASNVINIVVKDQNSGEVHFKVRSSPYLPHLSKLSRCAFKLHL